MSQLTATITMELVGADAIKRAMEVLIQLVDHDDPQIALAAADAVLRYATTPDTEQEPT